MDPTLVPHTRLNSARKFFCKGGREVERVVDEPFTADAWYDIDVSFLQFS